MKLQQYNKKRRFNKTNEPLGKVEKAHKRLIFVVQKHAARHLHYDFRLEYEGVLKSWAVPKGPSLNPEDKRLAVEVEDHPLAYANFEGTIPSGAYGAGTVIVWDKGYWEPEENVAESLRQGKLTFTLHGKKLRGKWTLLRLHITDQEKDTSNKNAWLLIKQKDDYANISQKASIVSRKPLSVKSNQSLQSIALHKKKLLQHSLKLDELIATKKKQVFPIDFQPELATLVSTVPEGDEWLHEIKFDGYRIITEIKRGHVRLLTRRGHDWSTKLPIIKQALELIPVKNAILDGELVALNARGISDFQLLQNIIGTINAKNAMIYYIFDVVYLEEYSLMKVSLIERKEILRQVLKGSNTSIKYRPLQYVDYIIGNGKEVYQTACKLGLEGTISKRLASFYLQKRTRDWLKNKCLLEQEFVIGGYTKPEGQRAYFGSLLLGYYDDNKKLIYAGHVGTGFTEETLRTIYMQLQKYRQRKSPFYTTLSAKDKKNVTWVQPKLVAQIRFHSWTTTGLVRQASFMGLRLDKLPHTVTREMPMTLTDKDPKNSDIIIDDIPISHPDKILYPAINLSKKSTVILYHDLAERLLPHIINRPLSIVRCPEGLLGSCFYQKHSDELHSKYIHAVSIKQKDSYAQYISVKDIHGLITLVQNGVIEFHPWGCTNDAIDKPDRIIFDLDPDTSIVWEQVILAAQRLRDILVEVGLTSYVKTTGGKGLHVVIPITRSITWDELRKFSKSVAVNLTQLYPDSYTINPLKVKRKDKIFIDYLRNNRGATAIAAYSLRAHAAAPIATPLTWDELPSTKTSQVYNASNIHRRIDTKIDPWKTFFEVRQRITIAMLK